MSVLGRAMSDVGVICGRPRVVGQPVHQIPRSHRHGLEVGPMLFVAVARRDRVPQDVGPALHISRFRARHSRRERHHFGGRVHEGDQALSAMHSHRLKFFGLVGGVQRLGRLLQLSPRLGEPVNVIIDLGVVPVPLLDSQCDPDVKAQGYVHARELGLGVQVGRPRDDPPTPLVGVNIPDVAIPTHDALGSHLFQVNHLLVACLARHVPFDGGPFVLWTVHVQKAGGPLSVKQGQLSRLGVAPIVVISDRGPHD